MKVTVKLNPTSKVLGTRGLDDGGRVQKALDSEVLRRSDPYVPMRTGALKKSGIIGTKIGSGLVQYVAPYAKKQYYNNAGRGRQGMAKKNAHNYKCLRGKLWFERMKTDHLNDILKTVKEKAGGK
ncbi:MAG: minor capsid protein [Acutalibacteraceae bacterium]